MKRIATAIAIATATLGLTAYITSTPPPPTECELVAHDADYYAAGHGIDPAQGILLYEPPHWMNPDGSHYGYSEHEDSRIYDTLYCARTAQLYDDSPLTPADYNYD